MGRWHLRELRRRAHSHGGLSHRPEFGISLKPEGFDHAGNRQCCACPTIYSGKGRQSRLPFVGTPHTPPICVTVGNLAAAHEAGHRTVAPCLAVARHVREQCYIRGAEAGARPGNDDPLRNSAVRPIAMQHCRSIGSFAQATRRASHPRRPTWSWTQASPVRPLPDQSRHYCCLSDGHFNQ
jgi:hypothetical protein